MQKTVEIKNFDRNTYKPGNKILIIIWYFVNVIFLKNPLNPLSNLKVIILRLFGAEIGKNVLIKSPIDVKYPWKLKIGDYSSIGEHVWINNLDDVVIGKNVCVSQGAMLLCGNHNYKKSTFDLILGKIILEDGVWIGAQSIVCPSVTCKSHSVLTVNSTATKDLEAYSIYQGTPAVKIKDRIIS